MAFNWNNNFQKGLHFKDKLLGIGWPFWTLIFFLLLRGALNIWSFSNGWRNRWSVGRAGYKSHSLVLFSFSFHLCSFLPPKINLDPKRLTYFTVESAQQNNIQSNSAWWLGSKHHFCIKVFWFFFISSLCLAGIQHWNPRGVGGHGGFCDDGGEAGTCQHGEFESLTVVHASHFKIRSSKQIKQPNLSASSVFVIRPPALRDAGCWGGRSKFESFTLQSPSPPLLNTSSNHRSKLGRHKHFHSVIRMRLASPVLSLDTPGFLKTTKRCVE